MPRPRTFKHSVFVRMSQVEHALTSFYAHEYSRDQTVIIRSMIKQYVRADEAFDKKRFLKYVEEHIMPEAKGDKELEEEIRSQLRVFLESVGRR